MKWKPALHGTYGPNMNAFWWVAVEIWTFGKLEYKTLSQCDGNAETDTDADNRGDCNSSPCTLYRRAKKAVCIERYWLCVMKPLVVSNKLLLRLKPAANMVYVSLRSNWKPFLKQVYPLITWATSWENLFMPYANNKGADQPAHPRNLISTFVVRCQDSTIPLVFISKISSL